MLTLTPLISESMHFWKPVFFNIYCKLLALSIGENRNSLRPIAKSLSYVEFSEKAAILSKPRSISKNPKTLRWAYGPYVSDASAFRWISVTCGPGFLKN